MFDPSSTRRAAIRPIGGRIRRPAVLAAALLLAGCISAPELDSAQRPGRDAAPYPDLVPLGPLLAAGAAPAEQADDLEQGLDNRLSRLRSRADALTATPVIDAQTKADLINATAP